MSRVSDLISSFHPFVSPVSFAIAVKYVDGWVEFADKKIAKAVARSLNNTIIGGKKRNYWHDDIWNIRYLKGFKWSHLTERLSESSPLFSPSCLKCLYFSSAETCLSSCAILSPVRIAYESKVRAQRLAQEVGQARKESNFYLEKVEQAKGLEDMRQRVSSVAGGLSSSGVCILISSASYPSPIRARSLPLNTFASLERANRSGRSLVWLEERRS